MAEECADDDDDKDAICELKKGVLEAMRMHDSFVQVKILWFLVFRLFVLITDSCGRMH